MAPAQWISDELVAADGRAVPCSVIGDRAGWAVVLAHPHPLYGGNRNHPLLHAIGEQVAGQGGWAIAPALRPEGAGDTPPSGPLLDLQAAINCVHGTTPDPLALVGYSFGAGLMAHHATGTWAAACAFVAPPADMMHLPEPPDGCLIVVGAHDTVVSPATLRAWAPDHYLAVIDGADHFLHGHIAHIAERVVDHITTERTT